MSILSKSYWVVLPALGMVFLSSCGGEEKPVDPKTIIQEIKTLDSEVILTEKQFNLGKMELGKIEEISFSTTIKSTGMFDVPPENKSTVSAYFGGYVKNIQLLPGQKINKGQTLFVLENPEYIQVQQDFLEAKSQLNYLKQDYERQKDLAKDNVSSQKTFSRAESDYKVTYARFESLKKRLSLMSIDPNSITESNIRTTISVTSPISGFITDVNATRGMFLNPSDVAVTIMNTDHLHIELKIFEQDLMSVKVGQVVKFRLQSDATEYFATVYLINKAIDPQKRTVNVHCHLANEAQSKQFTPGMFVEAQILTDNNKAFSLPATAVVDLDNSYFVLEKVATKSGYKFERKEVQIGESNEKFIEILNTSDFNENSNFLIKGAFNLINE
ncbi:MAG: efflux RND transporter periplasmic adaptor subunit [Crocinitomicaceae bacterium]